MMSTHYNPGYLISEQIKPVPQSLITEDGWIDAYAIQEVVQQSLQDVGLGVEPIGQGSFAVQSWQDVDNNGKPLKVTAGQWGTYSSPTPASIAEELINNALPLPPTLVANYQYRSLSVRYWTERYAGLNKPGGFYLGLTVFHGSTENGPMTEEHVAQWARILCGDFLNHIHGST